MMRLSNRHAGEGMSISTGNLPPQFEVVDRPLDTQMTISFGPQHPSTHGVLRLELVLDGEMVVSCVPDIGYLHTGMEKLFEYKKYQQGIVITDRMDYLNPLGNNLAYCMAVEKLLGIEIPERAQVVRVMMCELQRIGSHLVWLGTHALDLGAMTVFFYCFRQREKVKSNNIIRQALDRLRPGPVKADAPKVVLPEREAMKTHMDALIHHFLIVAEGFNVPAGEVYLPIEGSKGELGVYIKSDGGPKPARVHFRGPSFVNLSALPHMSQGAMIADIVAIIGSLDIVLGEIDR